MTTQHPHPSPYGNISRPAIVCKACAAPITRSPVAVLDGGMVCLQWTCRNCGRAAVQEIGEADYELAELMNDVGR